MHYFRKRSGRKACIRLERGRAVTRIEVQVIANTFSQGGQTEVKQKVVQRSESTAGQSSSSGRNSGSRQYYVHTSSNTIPLAVFQAVNQTLKKSVHILVACHTVRTVPKLSSS
jgi:hypothetical protein